MSLRRCLNVILMMGLVLALSPLGAQAEPPYERPYYHHPHGNAYGWDGPRHRDFDRHEREFARRQRDFERHQRYLRHSCMGSPNPRVYAQQVYTAPPAVAYVAPVAPIIGVQPYLQPQPQPQPYYSQPAAPGFHGQINF